MSLLDAFRSKPAPVLDTTGTGVVGAYWDPSTSTVGGAHQSTAPPIPAVGFHRDAPPPAPPPNIGEHPTQIPPGPGLDQWHSDTEPPDEHLQSMGSLPSTADRRDPLAQPLAWAVDTSTIDPAVYGSQSSQPMASIDREDMPFPPRPWKPAARLVWDRPCSEGAG